MEENKPKEMDLETKVELFERKAAGYRQNWMNAEDIIMTYQYMIEKDKQLLAEKEQEIQHLKEHIEKLEKNLNNLKGPVNLNHKKK
ncbi:hypothetical protein MOF19_16590 [Bacillus spizizenii]|nr:hypothetical protein [Bacillus spizizenii]MCY9348343.1 hypothetical protein [Bacillus spizizenii]